MTETELRETFAALRAEAPTDAELARALRTRPPRRRRHRRLAAGLAIATAAAAIAVAALPSGKATPLTPVAMLRAAAASAADATPAPFDGYRYTEQIEHWRWPAYPGRPATEAERHVETWVDRAWKGRVVTHEPRMIQGEEDAFLKPAERPYMYGDGPLADLDIASLPTDPAALRAALLARYAATKIPASELGYDVTYETLILLGSANTTPALRAALWGALALTPGIGSAPGGAVSIPTGSHLGNFTVSFDVSTSEILSWSVAGADTGMPGQSHTFVRAAHVRSIGDRPSP